MYHFTKFAIELNEEEEGVAPTDSRHRPDQRLMEQGKVQREREREIERELERERERERELERERGREYSFIS